MNAEERINTVLAGGIPDRVPCIPLIYYFAARYGAAPGKAFLTDMRVYRRSVDRCFREVGPWDAMYPLPITMDSPGFEITYVAALGMKPVVPSTASDGPAILQTPEHETLMTPEDYAAVMRDDFPGRLVPLLRFMTKMIARNHGEKPDLRLWLRRFLPAVRRLAVRWAYEMARWRARGVPFLISFSLEAPFDTFSMARGLTGFALDLRRRSTEIREAALKLSKSMAFAAALCCRATRTDRFLLLLHRSSNDFISPRQFADCAYPSIRWMAEYLDRLGIRFLMHCDGKWDKNLEVMTDLPRNCCFQFDGFTDMFRARKVLGDRFVLMGDVPSTLLAYGSPDEVTSYCRRLIDELGANGRFILSSGCEVPANARPENVRAMIDAARRFGCY